MYNYKTEEFGKFLKYTFYNDETKNSFSITPEHGASILHVVLDGQPIIDGHQTVEELLKNEWYKSTFLFPFPNRLKNGKYSFEGKSYQFQINDPDTKNALHGFGLNQGFKLISLDCKKNYAEIHCQHQNAGSDPSFPFAFSFDIKIRISEPNSFTVKLAFKNESQQNIPIGIGWHPYFNCFDKLDQVYMQMPDCQFVDVDEFAVPNGECYDYNYFQEKRQIGNVVLDNAFKIKGHNKKAEVVLVSNYGKLVYWQETGPGKFNFLQIFTPSHRRSIAIEPMTCNIDAFNNGAGLIILKPGAFFSEKCGFRFEGG